MAFSVRDEATDQAVRRLAKFKHKSLTDTIREAVEAEYERARKAVPLAQRLEEVVHKFKSFPKTGLSADKAFFDDLSGDV